MRLLTLAAILIAGGALLSFTDFSADEKEKEAILDVIRGETMSFYNKTSRRLKMHGLMAITFALWAGGKTAA